MKHKVFIFLICLAISFALWYIVGYSQKETVYFSLSTQVTGVPLGYVLSEQSEQEIEFQVLSSRHDIEKIRKKDKIAFDLSEARLKKEKGRYQYVCAVEPFLQEYIRQVNYNGYFELQSPPTITFFFEPAPQDHTVTGQ